MSKIDTATQIYDEQGVTGLLKHGWLTTVQRSPLAHIFESILGEVRHEKLIAAPLVGYWPHIKQPRSLNEKILHRKLYTNEDIYSTVSDKWKVRKYIEDKIGPEILNDVYYVGTEPSQIPFDTFPEEFVIKATHGSGWNMIIEDKKSIDFDLMRSRCEQWLNKTYGTQYREYWYEAVPPRIIAERFLEDREYGVPLDYKFFVIGGEVRCIEVDFDRYERHKQRFYDSDWNQMEFTREFPQGPHISEPKMLDEMIEIAEKLGEDFGFVRVDLYNPNGEKIVFGEITLAPQGGAGGFHPSIYDFKLGYFWEVNG